MSIALWVGQIICSFVMLGSGVAKSFMSKDALVRSGQSGVAHLSVSAIRFIGVCELLGAVGVVAPTATHIAEWLAPLAALGFAVIMVFAFRVHGALRAKATSPQVTKKETFNCVVNVVLFLVSTSVALGRIVLG